MQIKKLSPPIIDDLCDLPIFSETYKDEIKNLTSMLMKRGRDLWVQASIADDLRRQQVGDQVSFVVNQNINFTPYCIGSCRFCSYRRVPRDEENAFRLSLEDFSLEVEKALARGCTELCIQGGLDPFLDFEYYINLLKIAKTKAPYIHIHAFSPSEISFMSQLSGETVEDVLKELKRHGLGSIPGTAAEILVDKVRQIICPEKISTKQWVNIVLMAHQLNIKSTSTMMYGHVESYRDEAEHLVLLKYIQEISKGFTEFVPLPFIHQNTTLYHHLGARPGSTGLHDLALFSASRIYFGDAISNLQASWVKLGPKFAQVVLATGVNDLGGTLFSENISKSAGAKYGQEKSVEDFVSLIKDAGRKAVQRDTLYSIINSFE
ncbi:MAG: 5-amino-6-(D-ribitylamino)uracil--L-tyrosine 4-hydroxyphenyl transferase CofH [Candidatus Heimdallarchaeaceae archaeon]